jgi:hypothetical protein
MSKKDDTTSTAPRVKAFRDRLASSSYKRVEGYITSEEKARIDAVKTQLGVTTDVAVAGLLRMGLERYEKESTEPAQTVMPAAQAPAQSLTSSLMASGATHLCAEVSAMNGFPGDLMSFTCAASPSVLEGVQTVALNQASVSLISNSSYQAAQDNDNNPISRFFKSRKEMNQNV